MILLRRFVPALSALIVFFSFWLSTRTVSFALLFLIVGVLLLMMLQVFLMRSSYRHFEFWALWLTPTLLHVAAVLFFLFIEERWQMLLLGGFTALLIWLFSEHVFLFFYRPSRYRAYTIERLSLGVYVVTTFILSSAFMAFILLIQTPLWFLAPLFFGTAFLSFMSVLWLSKMDHAEAIPYALGGGVLMTELFIALSFLPIGYTVSAAVLATFLYLFLGLTRAHIMKRLHRSVLLRYLGLAIAALLLILLTAQWV